MPHNRCEIIIRDSPGKRSGKAVRRLPVIPGDLRKLYQIYYEDTVFHTDAICTLRGKTGGCPFQR